MLQFFVTKSGKAYRDLAIGFLIMQFIVTIARPLLMDIFGRDYLTYFVLIFAPSMIIIFPLAVRVVISLGANNKLIRTALGFFIIGILIRVFSIFSVEDFVAWQWLSLLSSAFLIIFLLMIIARMITNLFGEEGQLNEKLWASICVLFMFAAVFGTYYSILSILNPMAFGFPVEHSIEFYIHGMIYSLNILSGFDPVYSAVNEAIKMGAIMESTLSTLYLVVLLGRLLGSN